MNLLKRYVRAVGVQLPPARRRDVEAELASLIEDKIEAEQERLERELNETEMAALIKGFGHPLKVAAEYSDQRGLIGPELYPLYRGALWIALAIVLFIQALGLIAMLAGVNNNFDWQARDWYQLAGRLWNSVVYVFGVITLAFAAMERSGEDGRRFYQHWSPLKLPDLDARSEIKRGELFTNAAFLLVFLLLFNNLIDAQNFFGLGRDDYVVALTAGLDRWVTPINIVALSSVVLSAYVLARQAWTRWARIANIVLTAAAIVIALAFARYPEVLMITADNTIDVATLDKVRASVSWTFRIGVMVLVVVWSWEIVTHLRHLLRKSD